MDVLFRFLFTMTPKKTKKTEKAKDFKIKVDLGFTKMVTCLGNYESGFAPIRYWSRTKRTENPW